MRPELYRQHRPLFLARHDDDMNSPANIELVEALSSTVYQLGDADLHGLKAPSLHGSSTSPSPKESLSSHPGRVTRLRDARQLEVDAELIHAIPLQYPGERRSGSLGACGTGRRWP